MSDLQCPARIFVVRHAEAEYETALLADEGGSLTVRGRQQSRDLGERLRDERIAHIYSSAFSRATQTAEIAAAALGTGVTVRQALLEVSVGDFAGQASEPDPIRPIYRRWAEGEMDARIPGGESGTEVVTRVEGVLDDIADAHRGEAVLVVTHGGVMATALPTLARNLQLRHVVGTHFGNCDPVRLDRDADGWVAVQWPGLTL